MSTVTQYVAYMIQRQIEDYGLVVWYDPEKAYTEIAAELGWPNTTFVRYDGSFIKLRREIDPLMKETHPPRLVVYVPVDREQTAGALIELDSAGVVMFPGQQPPTCNTRLAVVARNVLRPILGNDQVVEIEKQVEAGKLTLSDLNSLAEQGLDISTGVVKLIFGTANPLEVALAFLHAIVFDKEIEKKEANNELRQLLQISFEIELGVKESLENWRTKLGRHVLLTDLVASLKSFAPSSLDSISRASSTGCVDACVRLAKTWRNSREYRNSYVDLANRIDVELQSISAIAEALSIASQHEKSGNQEIREVGPIELESIWERVASGETFLSLEKELLAFVEQEISRGPTKKLKDITFKRMSGFWSDTVPAIQARWALILSAANVLSEAERVEKEIKNAPTSVHDLVKAYAEEDEAWCLLDTHHRHMESRKYNFEFAVGDEHRNLEKLIAKAEQRYTEVGSQLAKHFVTYFAKTKHPIVGLLRQRDFFEKRVKPNLAKARSRTYGSTRFVLKWREN